MVFVVYPGYTSDADTVELDAPCVAKEVDVWR